MALFKNRRDAGAKLAGLLRSRGRTQMDDALVLALARDGVPVGFEVARALGLDLDVLTVRVVCVPGHDDLPMGEVVSGGFWALNDEVIKSSRITEADLARTLVAAREEIAEEERTCRRGPRPLLTGRDVVLVDDGAVTGERMDAAVAAVKIALPSRVVVAVPVGAPRACRRLARAVDAVVCHAAPSGLQQLADWYDELRPVTSEEVEVLLAEARCGRRPGSVG